MSRNPCYGYKVCYREQGKKRYVRYFLTYTHKQAVYAMNSYIRYPPRERETNRKLNNPSWKIIPVTRKKSMTASGGSVPFKRMLPSFTFY